MFKKIRNTITPRELRSTGLFLVMIFVILPFLPNRAIDPWGLFNLYRIWIMVILVAGISFFGYISIRLLGAKHGIGVAGLLGGLISSTAVAMSMARRVHENALLTQNIAIGISLASSMMLIRAGLEMWIIHPALAQSFWLAIVVGSLCGYGYLAFLYFTSPHDSGTQDMTFKSPFELKEALIMGVLFGVTLALITLANRYLGSFGVYAVAAVSGMSDVDAIVLSLSSLAKNGLNPQTAYYAIVIAIFSNTLTKMALVFFLGTFSLFRFVFIYYALSLSGFMVTALITLHY